jgi:hypothetical protein
MYPDRLEGSLSKYKYKKDKKGDSLLFSGRKSETVPFLYLVLAPWKELDRQRICETGYCHA